VLDAVGYARNIPPRRAHIRFPPCGWHRMTAASASRRHHSLGPKNLVVPRAAMAILTTVSLSDHLPAREKRAAWRRLSRSS